MLAHNVRVADIDGNGALDVVTGEQDQSAQKRVTVAPGTVSRPRRTATVRARFPPWCPSGIAHPSCRSSIVVGSSCGTWSSAVWAELPSPSVSRL